MTSKDVCKYVFRLQVSNCLDCQLHTYKYLAKSYKMQKKVAKSYLFWSSTYWRMTQFKLTYSSSNPKYVFVSRRKILTTCFHETLKTDFIYFQFSNTSFDEHCEHSSETELIWQDFWFHKKKLWLFKNLIYIYYSFKIRLLSRKDQRANQNIPKWNALIWLVKWSLVLPDLEFVKLPKHLWNDQIGRFFGQRCSTQQSAILRWSQLKWSSEVWLT